MFGVAQAFKKLNLHRRAVFAGSSAGSLVGLALAVDADLYKVLTVSSVPRGIIVFCLISGQAIHS